MWIEVIIFIVIILFLIGWLKRNFSEGGRVEKQLDKLGKRILKLDNEVYKIFEENPKFDTEELAYKISDNQELYYKIFRLNKTIDITGKLIDALLDYYDFPERDDNRYQFKSGKKVAKEEFYKLYVEKHNHPFMNISVQEALKIREEKTNRKNKEKESKRKEEIHKELYGEE